MNATIIQSLREYEKEKMNATIIQALREYECELSTIFYEYFCKDEITTREYQNKKDSAMRRCKLKIDVAIEENI